MKSKLNHIIACVGEEAAEIAQAVGKIKRFGLYDAKEGRNNLEQLVYEFKDLIAVMKMLDDELGEGTLVLDDIPEHGDEKIKRVGKCMKYSNIVDNKLGQV